MNDAIISRSLGVSREYVDERIDAKIGRLSTNSDIFLFVSKLGNDTTGNGTQNNPYATIDKVLSVIPRIVNHAVSISIGEGEYTLGQYALSKFYGTGGIAMSGKNTANETKTTINSPLTIGNTTIPKLWIGNITFVHSSNPTPSIVDVTSVVEINTCTFLNTNNSDGLKIYNCPSCVIESCKFTGGINGLSVLGLCTCRINNMTANNVTNAISVFDGGVIIIRSFIAGESRVFKSNGGVVIYPNGTFNL